VGDLLNRAPQIRVHRRLLKFSIVVALHKLTEVVCRDSGQSLCTIAQPQSMVSFGGDEDSTTATALAMNERISGHTYCFLVLVNLVGMVTVLSECPDVVYR
jgi:hypothetical protein